MNAWKPGTHYLKGDIVDFGNKRYVALCNMQSMGSPIISSNWEELNEEPNMIQHWERINRYPEGTIVLYEGKKYIRINSRNITTEAPDISAYWKPAPEESDTVPSMTMYETLVKERNEAGNLLIKICELVKDTNSTIIPIGIGLNFLNQVAGLPEWWEKHKPKSEREKKIEKIASTLSLDGNPNDDFRKVAERVLQALGE